MIDDDLVRAKQLADEMQADRLADEADAAAYLADALPKWLHAFQQMAGAGHIRQLDIDTLTDQSMTAYDRQLHFHGLVALYRRLQEEQERRQLARRVEELEEQAKM